MSDAPSAAATRRPLLLVSGLVNALVLIAAATCVPANGLAAEPGSARVGAIQAFETDGGVLLFIALDRFEATECQWQTERFVAVIIEGGEVSHRESRIPREFEVIPPLEVLHPAASTVFPDGSDVLVHRYRNGRHEFFDWTEGGPQHADAGRAAELAFQHGLALADGADAMRRLKAARERSGWKELPTDPGRIVSSLSEPLPRQETLRPKGIPLEVDLDYGQGLIAVRFAAGERSEVRLFGE